MFALLGWQGAASDLQTPSWSPEVPAGHAPPLMAPSLSVSPLLVGQAMWFTVSGADPGDLIHLAFGTEGLGAGPCPDRLDGACLDVVGGRILRTSVADGSGMATLLGTPAADMEAGIDVAFQAVLARPFDIQLSEPSLVESSEGDGIVAHSPKVEITDENGNGQLDAGETFEISTSMTSHGVDHGWYPMLQLINHSPAATFEGDGSYVWFAIFAGATYTGRWTVSTDPSAAPGFLEFTVAVTELHCEVGDCMDANPVDFKIWMN
jgi:hypothetical protein